MKKLTGLNELYDENESLDATLVTAAGDLSSALAARAWAKAQERLKAQGIQPKTKPTPGKPPRWRGDSGN